MSRHLLVGIQIVLASITAAVRAEPAKLKLTHPQPHQVVQRTGVAPGAGFADVALDGVMPGADVHKADWEYRLIGVGERQTAAREVEWRRLPGVFIDGTIWTTGLRIPAGGWYRLEIRVGGADAPIAIGAVEPIGVGEVFVVAGQSYATNCNDEQFKVADPRGRVGAFDSAKNAWRVAHDPQPAGDNSDGGSIWPPLGDALAKELRVPIGFANVAVGATSSMQWMPDDKLHARLTQAGKSLGRFRAVLWQQGESDVIAKTSTEKYVENLVTIRTAAAKTWGFEPPWLLAKSTHHPTVYNDPDGEGRIRAGIDELVKRLGFRLGPDTDTLKGEHRGDAKSRRHFSGVGQRRAAELWLTAIRQQVLREENAVGAGRATQNLPVIIGR